MKVRVGVRLKYAKEKEKGKHKQQRPCRNARVVRVKHVLIFSGLSSN